MARVEASADVAAQAHLGDGTVVWHLAQVREHAVLGRNCIVGRGAYVQTTKAALASIGEMPIGMQPASIGPAGALTVLLDAPGARYQVPSLPPIGVDVARFEASCIRGTQSWPVATNHTLPPCRAVTRSTWRTSPPTDLNDFPLSVDSSTTVGLLALQSPAVALSTVPSLLMFSKILLAGAALLATALAEVDAALLTVVAATGAVPAK